MFLKFINIFNILYILIRNIINDFLDIIIIFECNIKVSQFKIANVDNE